MCKTVVQLFDQRTFDNPEIVAQYSKDQNGRFLPYTYRTVQEDYRALALALSELGIKRGDNVGLISDNRREWLLCDLAILALGAADVPRGRDAMPYEVEHILSITDAAVVIAENSDQIDKILSVKESLKSLRLIISIENTEEGERNGIAIASFNKLLSLGKELYRDNKNRAFIVSEINKGESSDVATIIFTSGTTGKPKGVMITHSSFLYQVENAHDRADFKKGQKWLSILPVWHAFERIMQYLAISETESICYSKPIGKIMLTDITRINPHYMGSVPRIWETVKAGVDQSLKSKSPFERKAFGFALFVSKRYKHYEKLFKGLYPVINKNDKSLLERVSAFLPYILYMPLAKCLNTLILSKVRSKFGKNFLAGISGGGTLGGEIADYFDALNIKLIDGYGLTETGPVIGTQYTKNTLKSFITPLKDTELKVVDSEGRELKAGEKGELLIRGKQIMKGYYKDSAKTAEIMTKDGYLRTGDLAVLDAYGNFALKGRVKDTIVLLGGENIEPGAIEDSLNLSPYIETAVVVGQDKKYLGALIVIDKKNVERYLKDNHISYVSRSSLFETEEVKTLINREIAKYVSSERGFKSFEQISRFTILLKSFEVGTELSAKQSLKRNVISDLYKKEIAEMFK